MQIVGFPESDSGRRRSPADWLWATFLIWTAVGLAVMILGIGERDVQSPRFGNTGRAAAIALLHSADAIWILFAAVTAYFHAVKAEGITVARTWAAIILAASTIVEWVGVRTGLPFGIYRYTDHFGWRLGGVLPAAIPLAWLVILLCGRYAVLAARPQATRRELATGVALLALLTDINLEFVAWKVRGYWIWYPDLGTAAPSWPPLQNYVSWFLLSYLLTLCLPTNHALRARVSPTRPILVLALMNAIFLAARLKP